MSKKTDTKIEMDEPVEGVEDFTVEFTQPDDDELFEQAKATLELEKVSEDIWDKNCSEDERWGIEYIMAEVLIWMAKNMNEWLPQALRKFDRNAVDINFRILMHKISGEITAQLTREETERVNAMRELEPEIRANLRNRHAIQNSMDD